MTQLKHTIYYLAGLCIAILIISYLISINSEIHFWVLNSPWISNEFLFSCCIGIFASIAVLISTELYKSFQIQKSVEQFLFTQLAYLYGQLQIASTNISNLLSGNQIVADNLLNSLCYTISHITPMLRSIDYNPLCHTKQVKIVSEIIERIRSIQLLEFDNLAADCNYLGIAINTDKINSINNAESHNITAKSPNTHKTLLALNKEIQQIKSKILIDITELNTVCDNRFHWNEVEQQISNAPTPDTSLTNFWNKYN